MKTVNIPAIMRVLKKEFESNSMPVVDLIEEQSGDPLKILIGTILSARTKDETTRDASQRLFSQVHTVDDLDKLTEKHLQQIIFPVGFYRTKARHLKELPSKMRELFDGRVPDSLEDLMKLPGVGRKTANLVMAIAFKKPAICVDTHVHRICNRFGYINTKTPFETEMALREKLPRKYWLLFNSYLVSFGQNTCRPVSPRCSVCPVQGFCNQVGVKNISKSNQ
ncbi:MAG: endonuclease III [Deltaproteobacteria bacterium]|nr:endonuclease III [Deltaproteobacteria bacterium]